MPSHCPAMVTTNKFAAVVVDPCSVLIVTILILIGVILILIYFRNPTFFRSITHPLARRDPQTPTSLWQACGFAGLQFPTEA